MATPTQTPLDVSHHLIEVIRSFPAEREVEHCGSRFAVSPLDFYAQCPACGTRFKLRSFSGAMEIEDVFDAVIEWMDDPVAMAVVEKRRSEISEDED